MPQNMNGSKNRRRPIEIVKTCLKPMRELMFLQIAKFRYYQLYRINGKNAMNANTASTTG